MPDVYYTSDFYRKRASCTPSSKPVKLAKQNASMILNQQENHELTDQARENDYTLPPGSELVTFTNEHSSEVMEVDK